MFFDQINGSITKNKSVDRLVGNSQVIGTVKDTFFTPNGNGKVHFKENLQYFLNQFGMKSEDVRNLSISALLLKMMHKSDDETTTGLLRELTNTATTMGISDKPVKSMELV